MTEPSYTPSEAEVEAAARVIEPDAFETGCSCESCEKWKLSARTAAVEMARAALTAAAQVRERAQPVRARGGVHFFENNQLQHPYAEPDRKGEG